MSYKIELAQGQPYMVEDYDSQFKAEKAKGMNWYPWVGKNYKETGILIVGMAAYYKNSSSEWRKFCDEDHRPNRVLVSVCFEGNSHKPFEVMAKMFIGGAGKNYEDTRKKFWSSVAFLNFCQKIVKGESGSCKDVENAKTALLAAIRILKPKLVLAWTTQLWNICSGEYRNGERFGHPIPRAIDGTPPIVGIKHPSRWSWPNAGEEARGRKAKEWLEFLRNDLASKEPIEAFLNYLKQQPAT